MGMLLRKFTIFGLSAVIWVFSTIPLNGQCENGTCEIFKKDNKIVAKVDYQFKVRYKDGTEQIVNHDLSYRSKIDFTKKSGDIILIFNNLRWVSKSVQKPEDFVLTFKRGWTNVNVEADKSSKEKFKLFEKPEKKSFNKDLKEQGNKAFIFPLKEKKNCDFSIIFEFSVKGVLEKSNGNTRITQLFSLKVSEESNSPSQEKLDWLELQAKAESKKGTEFEGEFYLQYLDKYPNGKFSRIAAGELESFYEKYFEEYLKVEDKNGRIDKLNSYRIKFPESAKYGGFIRKVEEEIKKLGGSIASAGQQEDEIVWAAALQTNSHRGYSDYLRKFPNGKYKVEANKKLNEIQGIFNKAKKDLDRAKEESKNNNTELFKAYSKFLKKVFRGPFNLYYSEAVKEKNRLANDSKIFSATVNDLGNGKINVKVFSDKTRSAEELRFEFEVDDAIYPEINYIKSLNETRLEKINNLFSFNLSEFEGGSYKLKVSSKNEKVPAIEPFIVSIRKQEVITKIDKDTINLRVRGGSPPFMLRYKQDKGKESYFPKEIDLLENAKLKGHTSGVSKNLRVFKLNRNDFDKGLVDLDKEFYIAIVDENRQFVGEKDKEINFSNIPFWERKSVRITGGVILLLLFLFIIFYKPVIIQMRKSVLLRNLFRLKPLPKKTLENKDTQEFPEEESASESIEQSNIVVKTRKDRKKMVIENGEDTTEKEEVPFLEKGAFLTDDIFKKKDYFRFQMNLLWKDSIIETILLKDTCIAEINKDLDAQLDEWLIQNKETKKEALEVGGFLLGKFGGFEEEGKYFVSLEKYIPSRVKQYDAYEVELEMTDIDDHLEKNPKLSLIGWFHTHPGHGLFLSGKDLNIQRDFFNKPYQLAMEADPLTQGTDVAFFTWKTNMDINNRPEDRSSQEWFKWDEIRDWRKNLFLQ